MSVGTGITKVADSEEEPLTSSSAAVSGEAVDKLSATARQDTQARACPHQESAQESAQATTNEASNHTADLCFDQGRPSSNVETAQIDHSPFKWVQPAENTDTSTCTIEDQVKTTIPPLNVNGIASSAGDQVGNIEAHEDGGEHSTSLRVKLTSSDDVESTQFLERSPAPAKAAIEPIDRKGMKKQPGYLRLHHNDIVHDNNQATSFTVLSPYPGNHLAGVEEAHRSYLIDEQAVNPYSPSTAVQHKMQEQEDVACKATSVEPSSNIDSEDAVDPAPDTTIHFPIGIGYPQQNNVYTTGALGPVNSSSTSEAIISGESHGSSVRNASDTAATMMTTTSEFHDSHDTVQDPDSKQVPESTGPTGTPASPFAIDLIFRDNNQENDGSRAHSLANAQKVTGNIQELHDDWQTSNDVSLGDCSQDRTMNVDSTEQKLAALPTDQSSQESGRLREEISTTTKERVSGIPTQITNATVDDLGKEDTRVKASPGSISRSDASRSQTLSTVSLASEATSPHTIATLTPQEIKLAELKAQKVALLASLATLPAIQVLIEESQSSDVEMSDNGEPTDADITVAANKMVKEHIKLLHEYNELKDIGQGLMGLIADQRGVRIVEVQDELGIDAND